MVGILDRHSAAGRVADRGRTGLCDRRALRRQFEHIAIVLARQLGVKPPEELGARSQHRHTLMRDGCEYGPANQDLPPGIAFAFCMIGSREKPAFLHAQPGEPFVERLETSLNSF